MNKNGVKAGHTTIVMCELYLHKQAHGLMSVWDQCR